jgi:hypothetical protein
VHGTEDVVEVEVGMVEAIAEDMEEAMDGMVDARPIVRLTESTDALQHGCLTTTEDAMVDMVVGITMVTILLHLCFLWQPTLLVESVCPSLD